MSNFKKVIVSLPETLLKRIDLVAKEDSKSRSGLIREILAEFLIARDKKKIREQMISGYKSMESINMTLAEEGIGADLADLEQYELSLKQEAGK